MVGFVKTDCKEKKLASFAFFSRVETWGFPRVTEPAIYFPDPPAQCVCLCRADAANWRGYSNARPSFFALGYDTVADFAALAPSAILEECVALPLLLLARAEPVVLLLGCAAPHVRVGLIVGPFGSALPCRLLGAGLNICQPSVVAVRSLPGWPWLPLVFPARSGHAKDETLIAT